MGPPKSGYASLLAGWALILFADLLNVRTVKSNGAQGWDIRVALANVDPRASRRGWRPEGQNFGEVVGVLCLIQPLIHLVPSLTL